MNKSHHSHLGCASMIVLAAFGLNAQAVPVLSTNAQFIVGGTLIAEDPKSGPPPATLISSTTVGGGLNSNIDFSGDASANAVSTSGIGAVRADGVFAAGSSNPFVHELRAKASFGESVTNTTGATQDYFFDFNVFGPRLEIADFAFGADATVQYSIEVLLNGLPIWDSAATLVGSGNGFTLTQSGTDLGATFFCVGAACNETSPGSRFGFSFGDFSGQLALGPVADGSSFTLETIMNASVTALPFELGGLALIGDPNSIGSTPGVSGSVSTGVIPVPAAVWLFGSGLIGLIGVARRKAA